MKIYDNQFNANEWFVILGLCLGLIVTFVLPRRFSTKLSTIYFICGVTFGQAFDLTLGTIPVSYYDLDDVSTLEIMDILSSFMYGPFSYFFYVYDLLHLKPKFSPLYILSWALKRTVMAVVNEMV